MLRHSPLFASLLLACAVLLAGCQGRSGDASASLPPGGDFVLQSAGGSLDTKALRGKVLVLFFGYTHCPDVCPTNLAAATQMLTEMSAAERSRVRVIFVSVDPARDSPVTLRDYASYFHPEMVGVTGSSDEIASVARNYGVGYVLNPPAADGSYTVDHSVSTYIVGPDGQLRAVVPMGRPTAEIVGAVRGLM